MTTPRPTQGTTLATLLREAQASPEEQYNADTMGTWQGLLSSFGVLNVGDPVKESKNRFNAFTLAPADYHGCKLEKPFTRVRGVSPGARFTRQVNIHDSAEFVGVDFIGGGDNAADMVVLHSGVTRFIGCTFERMPTEPDQTITVNTGANIVLIGCLFTGSRNTGSDIVRLSSGVATDGYAIGCQRTYGSGFGGTVLGSF